jgi:hypothetical protein
MFTAKATARACDNRHAAFKIDAHIFSLHLLELWNFRQCVFYPDEATLVMNRFLPM